MFAGIRYLLRLSPMRQQVRSRGLFIADSSRGCFATKREKTQDHHGSSLFDHSRNRSPCLMNNARQYSPPTHPRKNVLTL